MWRIEEYRGRRGHILLGLRKILFPLRFISYFSIGVEICPKCGNLSNWDITEVSGFRGYYQCKRCKHMYFPFRRD